LISLAACEIDLSCCLRDGSLLLPCASVALCRVPPLSSLCAWCLSRVCHHAHTHMHTHTHTHMHTHTHTHTHTQGGRTDLKYRKTGSVAVSLEYRPMEGLLEVHVVSAQFRSPKVACFLCPFSLSLSLSLSLARSLSPPRRTGLLVPPVFCSVFRRRCHARQQRQQRQGVPGVGGRRECGMEGVAGLQCKTGSVWE